MGTRAPFNNFVRFNPPLDGADGDFIRLVGKPCRLVLDPNFVDTTPPLSNSLFYFTIDEQIPFPPSWVATGPLTFRVNFNVADRVEFATLPGVIWNVLRVERCGSPFPPYWRASIAQLEAIIPSDCSIGYADTYLLHDFATGADITVTQTSPTTWSDGTYFLTAEVGDLDAETCVSTWVLVNGEKTRHTTYNGVGSVDLQTDPPDGFACTLTSP